jgi:hypothetical protein
MPEVLDNLGRYRARIAATPEAPVAGGVARGSSPESASSAGADGEAGSGGDD